MANAGHMVFFYLESDDIAVKRYHTIIDNIISNNCHWLAEIRTYLNHPHKCNILFSIDLYKISLRLEQTNVIMNKEACYF